MNSGLAQFFEEHTGGTKPKLLLACSGGIDSMVLAHMLLQQSYKPAIAHCNFKLRAEADADEEWLKNWAQQHNLEFFSTSFATAEYAGKKGISTQMAARELRYNFFDELMEEHWFEYLLTAHHADDSLETIFLKLSRKPELLSLAGIRPRKGKILRPLWLMSRSEIKDYAKKHQLSWREDASNADVYYQRNRLRHQVIPDLKNALPQLHDNWSAGVSQLHNDRLLLEQLIHEKIESLVEREGEKQKLKTAHLKALPGAESFLHHWLKPYGNFDIEAIAGAADSFSGKEFRSESHLLLLHRGELILSPLELVDEQQYYIRENDEHILKPVHLQMEKLSPEAFTLNQSPHTAALDFDKLHFPLTLRRWKAGDRFVPLGMKGHKKLSDFFIDASYSRSEKENTWLLCSGKEIAWVVGQRIDDRFKLSDQTKSIYFVRILN